MNPNIVLNPTFAVVAVIYGFAISFSFWLGRFAPLLLFPILLSLCRYGYSVLRTTAQGREHFLGPDVETANPFDEYGLVLHFVFFASLTTLLSLMDRFGEGPLYSILTWAGPVTIGFIYPASAAMIGVTSNLGAALNPLAVLNLMGILGWRYLNLLTIFVPMALLFIAIRDAISEMAYFADLVRNVLFVWGWLAGFALIGAALHLRRDRIAIPGIKETEEEREYKETRRQWTKHVDLAYRSIRSGFATEGYRELKKLIQDQNESIEVLDWLFETLIGWEDKTHALAVGAKLIERLLAKDDSYRAAKMFITCRAYSAEFKPPPEAAAAIRDYAQSAGWQELIDKLS